jgi:cyclopropane-fatty-acyl-phospholipid synthase
MLPCFTVRDKESKTMSLPLVLGETGWLPDSLLRSGIRQMLKARLEEERGRDHNAFLESLSESPIALNTHTANEQHYEVPPAFFEAVLGPRLKYSCCYYDHPNATLETAETSMLRLTCERAGIADGQHILELGCGWGSLTLWMAQHYPNAQITAVSNSRDQRLFIEERCRMQKIENVEVITADMNHFAAEGTYDRIVSVEMFEHMRNYPALLARLRSWLKKDGRLFVHIFCHRAFCYPYETEGDGNWMARHFFTGGMMPSYDIFQHFTKDFVQENRWPVNGMHYYQTAMDWLKLLDAQRDEVLDLFEQCYGPGQGARWVQRWRIFFLACAELFRYNGGREWHVAHYLLRPVHSTEVQ